LSDSFSETLIHKLYHEEDLDIRRYIPDKLAKIGKWEFFEALSEVLLDPLSPPIIQIECAEALGKIGNPKGLDALKRAFNTPNAELKRTIVWSVGQIGGMDAFHFINSVTNDTQPQVQQWIIKSLGRIDCLESALLLKQLFCEINYDHPKLKTEILRSLTNHYARLTELEIDFWIEYSLEILKKGYPLFLKQAAIYLLLEFYEHGVSVDIDFFEEYYSALSSEEVHLSTPILRALGFGKSIEFLRKALPAVPAIIGLGIAQDVEFLEAFLVDKGNFNDATTAATLQGLAYTTSTINIDAFLSHQNLEIRLAAIAIHCKRGRQITILNSAISEKKGINSLLLNYKYYGFEGLDKLEQYIITGNKAQRQTSIRAIGSAEFLSNNSLHQKLKNILTVVKTQDTVWHIRRDARFLLQVINK
jgi:HEAT repeat protein